MTDADLDEMEMLVGERDRTDWVGTRVPALIDALRAERKARRALRDALIRCLDHCRNRAYYPVDPARIDDIARFRDLLARTADVEVPSA